MNIKNTPYTYMLGWRNRDTWYYGVRFAKGCDPTDLWVKYKSSSKLVKQYTAKHGDPDIIRVMRTFTTREAACVHEMRFIRRWKLIHSSRFLNRGNSNLGGRTPVGLRRGHTPETIEKMRMSWANRAAAGYVRKGRRHTDDQRAAISERQKKRFSDPTERDRQRLFAAAASRVSLEKRR